MFGNKATKFYALFVIAFVMVGSVLKVDLVWNLSDIFNGLMVIPNIIGIIALSNIVANLGKEYDDITKVRKMNEKILKQQKIK